jgi:hypothetical protein
MNTCCTPRQVRRAVQVSPELAALLQKRRPRENQE